MTHGKKQDAISCDVWEIPNISHCRLLLLTASFKDCEYIDSFTLCNCSIYLKVCTNYILQRIRFL